MIEMILPKINVMAFVQIVRSSALFTLRVRKELKPRTSSSIKGSLGKVARLDSSIAIHGG